MAEEVVAEGLAGTKEMTGTLAGIVKWMAEGLARMGLAPSAAEEVDEDGATAFAAGVVPAALICVNKMLPGGRIHHKSPVFPCDLYATSSQ